MSGCPDGRARVRQEPHRSVATWMCVQYVTGPPCLTARKAQTLQGASYIALKLLDHLHISTHTLFHFAAITNSSFKVDAS